MVQATDGVLVDRKARRLLVNQVESVAVAANLFFVAVPQPWLAKDERPDPALVDLDAFQAIGGDGAFDEGMFAQHAQHLGRLPREEFLPAACLTQIAEIPGRGGRNILRRLTEQP